MTEKNLTGNGVANHENGSVATAVWTEEAVSQVVETAEKLNNTLELLLTPEFRQLLEQMREAGPSLAKALKHLEALEQTGALERLVGMAAVLNGAMASMTDGMIIRMANTGRNALELMDLLMNSGVTERLPAIMEAVNEAQEAAASDKSTVGLFDLMRALKKPEMQYTLKFMLALTDRLPKAMQG